MFYNSLLLFSVVFVEELIKKKKEDTKNERSSVAATETTSKKICEGKRSMDDVTNDESDQKFGWRNTVVKWM